MDSIDQSIIDFIISDEFIIEAECQIRGGNPHEEIEKGSPRRERRQYHEAE
jgi:hypothetical protein